MTAGVDPPAAAVERTLAAQLVEERTLPAAAHLVLVATSLFAAGTAIPGRWAAAWAGALALLVAARALFVTRAQRPGMAPATVRRTFHVGMAVLGLIWGLGVAAAAWVLPTEATAIVILGLAGLFAGGLATLVADRWSFPIYGATMFSPVLGSVLVRGTDRLDATLALLIVAFVGFTLRLHRRAHQTLRDRLEAEERRRVAEENQRTLLIELQHAVAEVRVLRGILPICAECKRIRTDSGGWEPVESFVREHTHAEFSHGLCPDCVKKTWG